jgi:hypothetical protein
MSMRQPLGILLLITFSPFILAGFIAATARDAFLFGGDLFERTDQWIMGDDEE